jgi:GGDEF domain-containing protein
MIIDGVAASEALDTAGEVLEVEGCDISDLEEGKATLNFEHRSGQDSTPLDVVGKIVSAKKIYKPEDCENDRQRYYLSCVKVPYIYVVARLFDDSGHEGARALAAIIRDCQANKEPILVRYSIEGSTLERRGHRLTSTVARAVAATVRPANRTCLSGVVEDGKRTEKREASRLAGSVEVSADPELPAELSKALEAGYGASSPGSLVQGGALQKKTEARRPMALPKPAREQAKPKAARQQTLPGVSVKPAGLTVQGAPIKENPKLARPFVDETSGVMRTPRGDLRLYLPAHDGTDEHFKKILSDPKIEEAHGRAMHGWVRTHDLLRQRRLPSEVVMHSVLFSELSPNTPVPIQELMYSKLVDAMAHTGHDPSKPGFEPAIQHWKQLNRPDEYPEHARSHFIANPGAHTQAGVLQRYAMAKEKGVNILRYHQMHDQMVELANRHGADARSAVGELMRHKIESVRSELRRKVAAGKGKPDPGRYEGIHPHGLAPKTSRYAWGMMGGGNVTVPDTHFLRHLFGLRIRRDSDTIEYVKNLLWDPRHTHLLDSIDRWYSKNHPAVQHMVEHPVWGKHFATREDAIFPAFWRHWMAIAPHERLRNMPGGLAANELTTHAPYWEAIDPFMAKGEPVPEAHSDLPLRTALVHRRYAEAFGEVPASMLYHAFLAPRLLDHAERRTAGRQATAMMAGSAPRLERLTAELRSHLAALPSEGAGEALYHGGPSVREVHALHDGGAVRVGRYMVHDGSVRHLEDYHGVLSRLLPEGPADERAVAMMHSLEASPHLRVQHDHDYPRDEVEAGGERADAPRQPAAPAGAQAPAEGGVEVYEYQRAGMSAPATLEVSGDAAYLNGSPVPPSLVRLMARNARTGAATLRPARGLSKGEGERMGPDTALQHIRAAVQAGHVHPDVERALTRHIYEDKMAPGLGNKYAFSEFRARRRPGVYISMDGNDFSSINNQHGHDAGDQAIEAFGRASREAMDESVGRGHGKLFRDPDLQDLYRNGGDEFVAHVPSYEHALRFVHALRDKMDALPPIGGTHKLSMSIGLGHSPEHADRALYEAKRQKLTPGGQRAHAVGQTPMLAHSAVPGREGPIALHHEAPPAPAPPTAA